MADPVQALRRARSGGLVDKRGREVRLDFADPLTRADIDELGAEVEAPLPLELTAVLAETRAIDGVEPIDFTGRTMDVEVGELSPAGLPIATDGAGNFWVLD